MTYAQALRRLDATARFGIKPGLTRIRALMRELGNPHTKLAVIHVAGTNGKGSVCSMVESCLREAGWTTGLYTSPHLVDARERVAVNGRALSREAFARATGRVLAAAARLQRKKGEASTYFELMTALALDEFARAGVDLVVLETGLGGRLDSTNLVTRPLATAITNISLEHTQWLGSTEAAIAGEKAGIIKRGSPLVTAAKGKALAVIEKVFHQTQRGLGKMAPALIRLAEGRSWQARKVRTVMEGQAGQELMLTQGGRRHLFFLPLLGDYQRTNLATAVALLDLLEARGYAVPEAARVAGLARLRWPGRLQLVSQHPRILLDGAHNPAGAKALAQAMAGLKRGRVGLVVGVLQDKDWRGILRPLVGMSRRAFLARPDDARGLDTAVAMSWLAPELRRRCAQYSSVSRAFLAARQWAAASDTLVVAGSLYTVGELLQDPHLAKRDPPKKRSVY